MIFFVRSFYFYILNLITFNIILLWKITSNCGWIRKVSGDISRENIKFFNFFLSSWIILSNQKTIVSITLFVKYFQTYFSSIGILDSVPVVLVSTFFFVFGRGIFLNNFSNFFDATVWNEKCYRLKKRS